MISGTGIDLVEISRIRRSIEKSNAFALRVFSEEEITYCQSRGLPFESFAGRFAAKEAFFKALGTGWRGEMAFTEVVVENDSWGKPHMRLSGEVERVFREMDLQTIHVSISHSEHYATAVVIIEK